MSDSIPDAVFPHLVSSPPEPANATLTLDPVWVFDALGSDIRLPIVKLLADGRSLSISQIAGALGRDIDALGKQLRLLRDAGLVTANLGQDRRQTIYQIPAALRPAPGILDFGFCRVELAKLAD